MATPQEKLTEALAALKVLQEKEQIAIKSSDLVRDHRERLLKAGIITPVMKCWYIPSRPEETGDGETTAWRDILKEATVFFAEYGLFTPVATMVG